MEYPLIIDGVEMGRLRVQTEGLYTVFEAELAGIQEGIYRIWLHGGNESAYLGLMQPWSGGMYLRRKLSRMELKNFPQNPEYASNQNGASLHNENNRGNKNEIVKENAEVNLHNNNKTVEETTPELPEKEAELLWFRRPDGSLVSFDGQSSLVALPVERGSKIAGARLRSIEGRQYMIFRY